MVEIQDQVLSINIQSVKDYSLISLIPKDSNERSPVDLCCVIDTSGSMNLEATMKNEQGIEEAHGLSILDIVKHAVKTIILNLDQRDRLSIVEYNTQAKTVFSLIEMNDEGKTQALKSLELLTAEGQTNLWDGLQTGLEIIRENQSTDKISSIFLLTDGQPNIVPPRGHIQMLQKYKQKYPNLSCIINTFGFGYQLDSQLLDELAFEGNGQYSFIPDSSFVGTVFVNSLSNLLATMAFNVSLKLQFLNGTALIHQNQFNAILGNQKHQKTQNGIEIDVGTIQYGQPKHFVLNLAIQEQNDQIQQQFQQQMQQEDQQLQAKEDNKNIQQQQQIKFPYFQVEVSYKILKQKNPTIIKAVGDERNGGQQIQIQMFRLQLVEVIKQGVNFGTISALQQSQEMTQKLIKEMKSSDVAQDNFIRDLLKDLQGQISQAFSKEEWFLKWGQHYLPSLANAHQLQQCNNFKDPGVQNYGGALFNQIKDKADNIFISLPPPKPSIIAQENKQQQNQLQGKGGAGQQIKLAKQKQPISNMKVYYNQHNTCFAGHCQVLMGDNLVKSVKDIKKNDFVQSPGGQLSKVICVVKTICKNEKAFMVELENGLVVTPWHPIKVNKRWTHPILHGDVEEKDCDAIYSFLLEKNHILIINGIECAGLAHGFKGEYIEHQYFGSQKVVNDLQQMNGWENGLVILGQNSVIRDQKTQLVIKLVQSQNSIFHQKLNEFVVNNEQLSCN